jgi:hypothetical protein
MVKRRNIATLVLVLYTTRNIIIGCVLSESVHLESLLDNLSAAVQDLIVADKCSTYQQWFYFLTAADNTFIGSGFKPEPLRFRFQNYQQCFG